MHCSNATDDLKALLDGELDSLASWRVRRHVLTCDECREEWRSLQFLNARLLSADWYTPETRVEPRPPSIAVKISAGAMLAVALIAALVLPTWDRNSNHAADMVAAAITHVNTWHFSGWKQIGGKHVPWDLWGRRRPYLFYEKIGQDITWDDGAQRLCIYPPDAALHRSVGMFIKTASQSSPGQTDMWEPSVEDMVSGWNWVHGGAVYARAPFRQTATQADFRVPAASPLAGVNSNYIYEIDTFTWLPKGYELHYDEPAKNLQWDTESLTPSYEVTIPDQVESPMPPIGYRTVDLTSDTGKDLTLESKVMAVDKLGNIMVRYRARLAGILLTPASDLSVRIASDDFGDSLYAGDSGAPIQYMHATGWGMSDPDNDGSVYEFYSPLEPLTSVAELRGHIHVKLGVSPNIRISDTDTGAPDTGFDTHSTIDTLLNDSSDLSLAVPSCPTVRNIKAAVPPSHSWLFHRQSAAELLDQQRAGYYYMSPDYFDDALIKLFPSLVKSGILAPDGSNAILLATNGSFAIATSGKDPRHPDYAKLLRETDPKLLNELRLTQEGKLNQAAITQTKIAQLRHAIYWQKRVIADDPDTHFGHIMRLRQGLALAEFYKKADDDLAEKSTLRNVVNACWNIPDHGGLLRRQAEYALRTGQFPGDANYAGPTQ